MRGCRSEIDASSRSSSSRNAGTCSYASRSSPTFCAPWPGKSRAIFRSSNGPCAKTAPGTSWTGTEDSGGAIRSAMPSPRFSSACAAASSLSERTSNESATTASRASPWARSQIQLRVLLGDTGLRRQLSLLQREGSLDQPGDAGGGHRVPDVRLHASDRGARAAGRGPPRLVEELAQRAHLDDVAHGRGGP